LGLAVRPLAPQEKQQAETDGNLVVEHVSGPRRRGRACSPATSILGVNGKRVKSLEELQTGDQRELGKNVALLIQRENRRSRRRCD